jgi:SAM-dependent methyltransferase
MHLTRPAQSLLGHESQPRAGRGMIACDLCGRSTVVGWWPATPARRRTAICACGHIFAWPTATGVELDNLNDQNPGDPGSSASSPGGVVAPEQVAKEEQVAAGAVQVITAVVPVLAGRRVLSLRCLTGALAAKLAALGAEVWACDPFLPNVTAALSRRVMASWVPMSSLDQFIASAGTFDVIEGLSVHVLGHVASPARLLTVLRGALGRDGLLFLDEKDVLRPTRRRQEFVLDSGQAHQHHLTLATMAAYLDATGYETIACADDLTRRSDYTHMGVIARPAAQRQIVLPTLGTRHRRELTRLYLNNRMSRMRRALG